MRLLPSVLCILLSCSAGLSSAHAAGFELAVAPSRVEVSGKSGARIGQSLSLINVGGPTEFAVRTLDWDLTERGEISYFDELRENSCRPWVTLERRFVRLGAQGRVPFRFQVDVPPDAPRGECRFMIAIEGVEPAYRAQMQSGGTSLNLPVSGRIAVAVYVFVNGAEPKLEIKHVGLKDAAAGTRAPVVTVTNSGDAHGRLEGGLESVDAKGNRFELIPEGSPVLPGQTRVLKLQARSEQGQQTTDIVYPVRSEGQLDWERGSFKVKVEFK